MIFYEWIKSNYLVVFNHLLSNMLRLYDESHHQADNIDHLTAKAERKFVCTCEFGPHHLTILKFNFLIFLSKILFI
jgi:hypothetical protein